MILLESDVLLDVCAIDLIFYETKVCRKVKESAGDFQLKKNSENGAGMRRLSSLFNQSADIKRRGHARHKRSRPH